jgi:hypothetical protein
MVLLPGLNINHKFDKEKWYNVIKLFYWESFKTLHAGGIKKTEMTYFTSSPTIALNRLECFFLANLYSLVKYLQRELTTYYCNDE